LLKIVESEYPIVDGHVSMGVYINAMLRCYDTLREKQMSRYKKSQSYKDFDFFAFHTPFSKMV
jgi:3-hydroxy-3-methylglutaryl CoA synthase